MTMQKPPSFCMYFLNSAISFISLFMMCSRSVPSFPLIFDGVSLQCSELMSVAPPDINMPGLSRLGLLFRNDTTSLAISVNGAPSIVMICMNWVHDYLMHVMSAICDHRPLIPNVIALISYNRNFR